MATSCMQFWRQRLNTCLAATCNARECVIALFIPIVWKQDSVFICTHYTKPLRGRAGWVVLRVKRGHFHSPGTHGLQESSWATDLSGRGREDPPAALSPESAAAFAEAKASREANERTMTATLETMKEVSRATVEALTKASAREPEAERVSSLQNIKIEYRIS